MFVDYYKLCHCSDFGSVLTVVVAHMQTTQLISQCKSDLNLKAFWTVKY